jgi:hypothetical protein
MNKLLYIIVTVLIVGCGTDSNNSQKELTNNSPETAIHSIPYTELKKKIVDSITGAKLEELLQIPVRKNLQEVYSGSYSYSIGVDGKDILDGKFEFSYRDSSTYKDDMSDQPMDDIVSISKVHYSGEFRNGKKIGTFIEKLLTDDGVDIYSHWTASIDFNNDSCTSGSFTGVIGHVMPEKVYRFKKIKGCSFDNLVEMAWAEWGKEYEKQKNNR